MYIAMTIFVDFVESSVMSTKFDACLHYMVYKLLANWLTFIIHLHESTLQFYEILFPLNFPGYLASHSMFDGARV